MNKSFIEKLIFYLEPFIYILLPCFILRLVMDLAIRGVE